ncbi:unnamed protein product [Haemonchus placei]|uniref:Histone H4 n=1 Tax=Haemonchus placei TaxID=6290 RepID=A0A0N4WXL9_HAEPC|nr:unnamed protein product [Haemonchus placei]
MSGRGKGGKGLGKGGAKRHRKHPSKPAIRRLACRCGVKRIPGPTHEEARGVLKLLLENVIRGAVTHRACQEKDRHRYGRCLRSETSRTYSVRFRRIRSSRCESYQTSSHLTQRPSLGPQLLNETNTRFGNKWFDELNKSEIVLCVKFWRPLDYYSNGYIDM